jgi:hypothetical protein
MKHAQVIPWIRIAAEATAVLASILLAFAIDAWWAERLERVAEREELSRLHDEFASNYERIDSWVSDGGIVSEAREAALSVSETLDAALKAGSETVSLPDLQIAKLLQTPTFEAETPVLESLVRSGRIEIIENREIVKAIAIWERSLRGSADQEQRGLRFVYEQLLPALAANNHIQHVLLNQWPPVQVDPIDPNGVTEIGVDPLLVNLVAQRYFQIAMIHESLKGLQDSSEQVMSAIAKSIK